MRIAIIGAAGQLGTDLVQSIEAHDVVPLTHQDIEMCDFAATGEVIRGVRPDVVVNTAAYHQVDECEANVESAFRVNTFAVRNLAEVCEHLGCVLVHMSTDYVFGEEQRTPYHEDDPPHPLNVYGVSKLAGEYLVRNICRRWFIVRSSGLYGVAGASGKGGNFIETMLRLAREGKTIRVVTDQILTPTYTNDLAAKMGELIVTEAYGLYHMTSAGECSWYEYAKTIFELTRLQADLQPTSSDEFGARAKRPAYSVLDNRNLRALGMDDMRPWQQALGAYLKAKRYVE
jgi:dTDP-4-dehydrorhamnose reductase